jgi:hypothetical protein
MTPENLAALEAEAEGVLADRLAPRSRSGYRNSIVRFLKWMVMNKRHLVNDLFMSKIELDSTGTPTTNSIECALATAPADPPLDFDHVNSQDFMSWIVSMKASDGTYYKATTYGNHRSAFVSLFHDYRKVMSTPLQQDLAQRFSGLKKRIAKQIGSGHGEIKVGKDPLPFSLYVRLGKEMMQRTTRDLVFARTFMILSWNLMSRAANTVSICFSHFEWGEDSLRVYFAHMKNDQSGSRPRDPRHVYANPLAPEICPILAIGM